MTGNKGFVIGKKRVSRLDKKMTTRTPNRKVILRDLFPEITKPIALNQETYFFVNHETYFPKLRNLFS